MLAVVFVTEQIDGSSLRLVNLQIINPVEHAVEPGRNLQGDVIPLAEARRKDEW